MNERQQLEEAITALEAQRAILGDAVVDASINAMRERLAELEPAARDEQRKLVTVLFADLVDWTAMSERMDPEDVIALQRTYFDAVTPVIQRYGGRVEKYIGDAVLAVFGVPQAREDDPEQAVRAALAMQQALDRLRADGSIDIPNMRVAVHTGLAITTVGERREDFVVIGETANIVSHLQTWASPGGVLISRDTYRHVQGLFDVQMLDPLSLSGRTDPIQTYAVLRAKPRAFRPHQRGVEGVETRMIGREAEMSALRDAYEAAVGEGRQQMVTIVAEAGLGKSRLLYEFENWVDLRSEIVTTFRGRAREETQRAPYSFWRDMFAFRFDIQDDDPVQAVRQKFVDGFRELPGVEEQVEMKAYFVGRLMGFGFVVSAQPNGFVVSAYIQMEYDDPEQFRNRALRYLSAYLSTVLDSGPVLMLLEDLHWADGSSLDALTQLMPALRDRPLLIVAAARPALYERRSHWMEEQTYHQCLNLEPLSQRECRLLVAEVLQKMDGIPDTLGRLVVENADGNPFYVEELLKMLLEDGVIIKSEPHWIVMTEKLAGTRVPATLTGVIQARLDSLPQNERVVLQQASVIGRTFWDSVLAHLNRTRSAGLDENRIAGLLGALGEKEMVYRQDDSAFIGANEHIFKHAILREVTYESVLKRLRRIYHALVAEWLRERNAQRAVEVTGLIAKHLELAGREGEALVYLKQAGEEAANKYANDEAMGYINRALKLAPERDVQMRWELLLVREKINNLCGNREDQRHDLAALNDLAETSGDMEMLAEATLRRANFEAVTGDYPAAIAAATTAIELAQAVDTDSLEVESYLLMGQTYWFQREYQPSRTRLNHALTLARSAGLRRFEAESLRNLGIVSELQGEYGRSRASYDQALAIFREIGDLRGEANTLNNYGLVASDQDDYTHAMTCYDQALEVFGEIGDRQGESKVLSNKGIIYDDLGMHLEARSYFERALAIRLEIQDLQGESNSLFNLGVTSQLLGDFPAAKRSYKQALDIFRDVGDRQGESLVLSSLGLVAHYEGDNQSARDHGQQALLIAQGLGDRAAQADALTGLGHALSGLGELAAAASAYRQALAVRRELEQASQAMDALAGLARIALAQGDLKTAGEYAGEILAFLDAGHSLHGSKEPLRIYLTCWQVLLANEDPRARQVLETTYLQLQERASKITGEATRSAFVQNVPWRREIVAAWEFAAQQAGDYR